MCFNKLKKKEDIHLCLLTGNTLKGHSYWHRLLTTETFSIAAAEAGEDATELQLQHDAMKLQTVKFMYRKQTTSVNVIHILDFRGIPQDLTALNWIL